MSAGARHVHYTYDEYIALEETSPVRHEYWHGEIYAMAGGTPDHAALAAALIVALSPRLPPTCRAFTSDLRVYVEATELTTYPDVSVVCGKSQRAEKDALAVTNPTVLAEITSPSTEDYDRGEKLRHYKTIASVREIVIVDHRHAHVVIHRRSSDGNDWSVIEATSGTVVLASIDASVDVDALYARGLEDA